MSDDTLSNVTGRAWLVAELDRIAFELCPQLGEHYRLYRRRNMTDRREFVDALEGLKNEAFLTARAVADGACDVRSVTSVFNLFARLDAAIHAPGIRRSRRVTAGAVKGHEQTHGTDEQKQARWNEYQAFIDEKHRARQGLSYTRCVDLAAAHFKCSERTIRRHTTPWQKT